MRKEAKRVMEGKENETDFSQRRSEEQGQGKGKSGLDVTVPSKEMSGGFPKDL